MGFGKTAQGSVSQRHIYRRKHKKQADMVLPVSAKVSLSNNCPMLNVYDVVPRVKRINRTNKQTNNPLSDKVAIRPVVAATVPLSSVPPNLPLCPEIFDSKFAFVNTVNVIYTNKPFVILTSKAQTPSL